ncbi:hypothetical protein Noda2021_02490 [Candidatus Dependentiae bacterium Noda2021]|nr:hypothetical protein Noda2021_02490 [Candidatus Dependentiae bacterium Noda2021]
MKLFKSHNNVLVKLGTLVFFGLLIGITFFYLLRNTKQSFAEQMSVDVEQLAATFKKIDETAVILDFNSPKSVINFLNVKKGGFVGSEVGPMNLVRPDKWQGPYFLDNPMIQNKEYQVVRTKTGYYIVPGDGVILPNGKVMGKDLILDDATDIESLIQNGNTLNYQRRPLAAFIPTASARISKLANDLIITDQEMN